MTRLLRVTLLPNIVMLLLFASACRQTTSQQSEATQPDAPVHAQQPSEEAVGAAETPEEIKGGSSELHDDPLEARERHAGSVTESNEGDATLLAEVKEDRSTPVAETETQPPPKKLPAPPPANTVVLTGVLVWNNGEPASGKDVTLHEAKDGGYTMQVGEGGVVQNPSTETDDQGRFKLLLDRAVFEGVTDFTLTVPRNGWARAIEDENGAMIVIRVTEDTRKFDFGKIILK